MKQPLLSLNALLRGVSWARLVVAAFLVGVGPWVPEVVAPIVSGAILLLAAFTLVVPHVFEPLFSTRPDGGGLGLALAHRIAQEHDGEVTVRSEPGSGAEFTLHLPACHA